MLSHEWLSRYGLLEKYTILKFYAHVHGNVGELDENNSSMNFVQSS